MRNRTNLQTVSVGFMLLLVAGIVVLSTSAQNTAQESSLGIDEAESARPAGVYLECADLITPEKVGREEFERYDLAEKLRNGGFTREEHKGYIVCSHGRPQSEDELLGLPAQFGYLHSDMYYMFDGQDGELALTRVSVERSPALPTPTPVPTFEEINSILGEGADVTTVCFDDEIPIFETAGENPKQWTVWDLLSGGGCAVEMSSSICWDCGPDQEWRWLVPTPAVQGGEAATETGGEAGMACIDARTAVLIGDQELEQVDAEELDYDRCGLQLGGGQVCWHCTKASAQDVAGTAPSATEVPPQEATTQIDPRVADPQCADYMKPELIGFEAWEKYGIADLLRDGQFDRYLGEVSDIIVCSAHRMVDGARVVSDGLYYWFDLHTGELVMERIHWREDLPDRLPALVISQEVAESLVEGEVTYSRLAFLPPDAMLFEVDRATSRRPYWLVSSTVVSSGISYASVNDVLPGADGSQSEAEETTSAESFELKTPWVFVIDALTGAIVGEYCPC